MERWHAFALRELATVSFWCETSWCGIHRSGRMHEMGRRGFQAFELLFPVASLKYIDSAFDFERLQRM